MGRKNAWDVSDGTCVLLVELGGRPPRDPVTLDGVPFLGIPGPLLEGGDCDHGLRVDMPALAVSGRDDCTLCLFVSVLFCGEAYESPSSEAMSVIRDDIILGVPCGYDCETVSRVGSVMMSDGSNLRSSNALAELAELSWPADVDCDVYLIIFLGLLLTIDIAQ